MALQFAGDGLDAPTYPRTYEVTLGWKVFFLLFGPVFGLGGIALFVYVVLLSFGKMPIALTLFMSVISAALTGLGIYSVLSALLYRLIITSDHVEIATPFGRSQLSLADIRGRRTLRSQQGPATVILAPKTDSARKLKIPQILRRDPAFDAWITQFPDLDQEDLSRSEQEVEQALYQDQMPQERHSRINQLKSLAKYLTMGTFVLCMAGLYIPDYNHWVTIALIALPWVAVWLVARFQPLYRFGAKRNDAHPDLSAVVMLPSLFLVGRALSDVHTFNWSGPFLLACGGAFALGGAALRVDPWFRQQRWTAVLACIFTLVYGLGAGLEIDVLADSAKPSIYPTQVLGKRASRGSKSTTRYLRVRKWGPFTRDNEISVSAARYSATQIGDTVCIYSGKGALQVPWYQLRDCP